MAAQRPNVLCIITDQQRADHLSCYGNPDVQTPHIDRLAREGMRFTRSYVANPLCMPNRSSLFTGMYPNAHGVRENGIGLDPRYPVLPGLLREAGYRTASFGKLHLVPYSIDRHTPPEAWEQYEAREYWEAHDSFPKPYYGFEQVYLTCGHGPYIFGDYVYDVGAAVHRLLSVEQALTPPTGAKESWKAAISPEQHYNTRIADKTIEFLQSHDGDQPFFAWCSFPDPHHPYMPPAPYCDQYEPGAITFDPARRDGELDDLPPYFRQSHTGEMRTGGLQGGAQMNDTHYREILAHTYGMISMVDDQVGRIMTTLRETGLLDNTIVIFMSDHGDLMGDHWLINKGPYLFDGLTRVPTIWRLPDGANAGHVSETFVSAVDFAPTVLDFAGVVAPAGTQGESYRGVLTGEAAGLRDGAYIEYDSTYLSDRLRHLRTDRWALTVYSDNDYGLLYDLADDPRELHNRWSEPAYETVRQVLMTQLLRQQMHYTSWLPARKAHA